MRLARATAKRMARAKRRSGVGVRRGLSKGKAAALDKGKAQAATLAVALTAGALAVAGCGESTQTVSVGSAPSVGQTTGGQTTTQSTAKTTPNTPSTSTSPTTNTSATSTPSTTRTAQAPKFAEEEREAKGTGGTGGTGAEGLEGALKVLREHGYEAKETTEYHPEQTLRVLIGTGAQSNDGYDKRAFFFVDGKYIGTDASTPSAQVSVVRQSDTEVTLSYALYRPNDALCCPSGGQAKVTFQLNNGKLQPTGPIPPEQSSTGVSRQ